MSRWCYPLVGVACAIACGGGDAAGQGQAGVVGASIAAIQGGALVAVVNPDQGSVSFLDPDSLKVLGTTVVGGEPHTLLEAVAGTLLVANYKGGEVVAIDEASFAVTQRVSLCAGPYGLAASADATWVAVSCEWDGTVQHLDLGTYTASLILGGLHRPRALAVLGEDVHVADYIGGMVHDLGSSFRTVPSHSHETKIDDPSGEAASP